MVEIELKLYRKNGMPEIGIVGKDWKLQELTSHFGLWDEPVELVAKVTEKDDARTPGQLGYFMGVIAPAARDYFRSLGWQVRSKEKAAYMLIEHLDYAEVEENNKTGERYVYVPSLSQFGVKKLGQLIEDSITFLLTEGVYVMMPDEYKKIKKL